MKRRFQIYPHGLTIGPSEIKPAMIFKNAKETSVLPVWLDPLDAGILISESQRDMRSSHPHLPTLKLLETLDIQITSVYFDNISGSTQYATVTVVQNEKESKIKVRASEIMSLAAVSGCAFFTNNKVVNQTRDMDFMWPAPMEAEAGLLGDKGALH